MSNGELGTATPADPLRMAIELALAIADESGHADAGVRLSAALDAVDPRRARLVATDLGELVDRASSGLARVGL